MSIKAKICGLSTPETLNAAIEAGADYVGFVFYGPSPRNLTPSAAQALAAIVPAGVRKVALVVDADDVLLDTIFDSVKPDCFQAHGSESPERIAEIRRRYGIPVIKAIKVREPEDLAPVPDYEDVADMILFDAKAPDDRVDALPGGNGVAFDWTLLRSDITREPFMLSGGLDADNLARAVATTGATLVDVSSAVESAPGVKDIAEIRRFLAAAKAL